MLATQFSASGEPQKTIITVSKAEGLRHVSSRSCDPVPATVNQIPTRVLLIEPEPPEQTEVIRLLSAVAPVSACDTVMPVDPYGPTIGIAPEALSLLGVTVNVTATQEVTQPVTVLRDRAKYCVEPSVVVGGEIVSDPVPPGTGVPPQDPVNQSIVSLAPTLRLIVAGELIGAETVSDPAGADGSGLTVSSTGSVVTVAPETLVITQRTSVPLLISGTAGIVYVVPVVALANEPPGSCACH